MQQLNKSKHKIVGCNGVMYDKITKYLNGRSRVSVMNEALELWLLVYADQVDKNKEYLDELKERFERSNQEILARAELRAKEVSVDSG